jgi:mono/diheme cytochrome c family protein
MAKRRNRDFPWTEVLIVGAIAMLAAGFVGVSIGWSVRGNGGGASTAATSTAVTSTPGTSSAPPSVAVPEEVALGAHAFNQFACAQCHGDRGVGGVSPDVPALQSIASTLTVAQLTSIIEHGAGVSSNPTRPFMPIWHGVIAKPQISELVAYMKAGFPQVAGATPLPVPPDQGDAVAGQALYQRYGCINCHGPNGLGGVPNPQSPDKVVPPLVGKDFHAEFSAKDIAQIIRTGSVLGKAPIVSMPHWGTILSDKQIAQLVAYITTLT